MNLFVTVGNASAPFDRLLRVVDQAMTILGSGWAGTCQHGVSSVRPRGLRPVQFLDRKRFELEVASADAVVCHAGVGVLHTALAAGHRPLVMARSSAKGEHVNDHQVEIFDVLAASGKIMAVHGAAELARRIDAEAVRMKIKPVLRSDLDIVSAALDAPVGNGQPFGRFLVRVLALGRSAADLEIERGSGAMP